MKRVFIATILSIALLITTSTTISASEVISLSGEGWSAMLDPDAEWEGDKLYLPDELPADLSTLPQNSPTGGWSALKGRPVSVPMTIDEYFLDGVNTATYHGVSWVWRSFTAPKNLKGKLLFLNVAKARMRAEVYINEQLVAYDIIGETPFSFEVSRYVKAGEQNQIAVRLTNPGGRRGWRDSSDLIWGEYAFSSNGRDFTTLGDVELSVKPLIYIDDIFVKNTLPTGGKRVEVNIEIVNNSNKSVKTTIPIEVTGEKKIASTKLSTELKCGKNSIKIPMTLTQAEIWSPETPNLYTLTAKVESDEESVRFGVRTFEVKKGTSGGHNYYLNGKRFIFKTAIDWNYYAPTGDYATRALAEKSVEAAKAMGQNGISCHRNIGEPEVFKVADSLGLCIYEEQGGFHPVNKRPGVIDSVGFTPNHIKEKIRRMVIRDRNHPSIIIFSLSNEDQYYYKTRKEALELINSLDDSRLVINTSGPYKTFMDIEHIRPYESNIRLDYLDRHTAYNRSPRYGDDDFYQEEHREITYDDRPYFLGEVNSVSGPENWYKTYKDIQAQGKPGYDTNIYKENHDKVEENFERWNISSIGSRSIVSPEELSMQCGRGMMYAHARHAQSIMCNNSADGYALNGWTPGPQSEGSYLDWSSGILDEARNLKAPADSYTYWTKPLQISLSRKNGKYFDVNEEVIIESNLINHGELAAGTYEVKYTIGEQAITTQSIKVIGGECYAQPIGDVTFTTDSKWSAGYITLKAKLYKQNRVVAEGSEQILLRNRASYSDRLKDIEIDVKQWDEAQQALEDAGAKIKNNANIIVAGDLTNESGKMSTQKINTWEQLNTLLDRVKAGATLIIRFDKYWAEVLHESGILKESVTEWGGNQTTEWLGNGWGYMDHFVGYDSTANSGVIGTTSWEVPSDPIGFYPFVSDYKMGVYGVYMCRPWLCKIPPIGYRMKEVQPTMAVLMGTLDYGSGKIILNPCYTVDQDNAFCDMLFYNMILNAADKRY